jgi:SAM-dependent methyltransferase
MILKMYGELAAWWPLLSPPSEYAAEAAFYHRILLETTTSAIHNLLELGSGGGNNASFLKEHFRVTLVDLSPDMLVVSRQLNPDCEHLEGDMRTVRLERHFDAVFIHDAIDYMITESDLRQAVRTAYVHLRPGGVLLLVPDHVRETYRPVTSHGGHDGEGRALRYLEWSHSPEENDTICIVDYVYLLREGPAPVRVLHERHITGLFPRATWLRLLAEIGFTNCRVVVDDEARELFVALKPDEKEQ